MSDNNNDNNREVKRPKFSLTWLYLGIIGVLVYMLYVGDRGGGTHLLDSNYTNFKAYIREGYAERIIVNKDEDKATLIATKEARTKLKPSIAPQDTMPVRVTTTIPTVGKLEEVIETATAEGRFKGKVEYAQGETRWLSILLNVLPIVFFALLVYFSFRNMRGAGGGGIFSVGKSKAKLFDKESGVNITFKDVAGQEGAKEEVQEIVDFLKNPQRYTELGGKIPKGALLVGPPGTGKTLLAKAVAGEAHVPFFSMSGSDFVEMFVGVGASRVRDLFEKAKAKSPCIIFIDEIDAIGRARSGKSVMGGNEERENTLNQLLTEMDGFGTNSGVIILAATNRVDILDKALLRAGRFDRQIHVELPELKERIAIFGVHLRPLKVDDTLNVDLLARQTPGFSGADIANVCNEAALIAARKGKTAVGHQEFLDAVDRIIGGLEKKSKVMTLAEKRTIALHEAGHAVVSWFLEHANPLVKVTIVPRGQALGAAWYMPEERNITTEEQMLHEVCATLGGRAAEEVFLGKVSSGALNDLERVTKRVYSMVAYLGMSPKLYNMSFYNQEAQFAKPYSERTAELIDTEVQAIIAKEYERAMNLLREHSEGHARLTQLLMEREVIFTADMEEIFGPRPWKTRTDLLEEEETQRKAEEVARILEEHAERSDASDESSLNSPNAQNTPSTQDTPSSEPSTPTTDA